MIYINKNIGKICLVFYSFLLYNLWHLCQYGGVRSHLPEIAVGILGFVITFGLWVLERKAENTVE